MAPKNYHLQLRNPRQYWTFQLVGWITYFLINVLVAYTQPSKNPGNQPILLFELVTIILCGFLITHIYRKIIHGMGWLGLNSGRTVLLIFLSSLIQSALLQIITMLLLMANYPAYWEALSNGEKVLSYFNYMVPFTIWQLLYFGVHYFANYKKAEIEKLKAEAQSKEFELTTMRSQINPHFIFNALTSLRVLVSMDPEKAKDGISRLSKMLRRSLYFGQQQLVTLKEELQGVEDYLALEQIRFEEKLNIYWEDNISNHNNLTIPPMVVLTLVENSIKHGVSRQSKSGFVRIKLDQENENLNITIENNGSYKPKSGYGLENLQQRLTLLYPNGYSFNIKNVGKDTVEASISIPISSK